VRIPHKDLKITIPRWKFPDADEEALLMENADKCEQMVTKCPICKISKERKC
jgi:hypothetical protein